MIQPSEILSLWSGASHLVGFKQPTEAKYAIVDAGNLTSESGLYFNSDFSPLVTIRNIIESVQEVGISGANFNNLLERYANTATIQVMNAAYPGIDLIENKVLYPNYSDKSYTLDNGTDFVGYEIKTSRRHDVSVQLNQVIHEFDKEGETVKLLLFHSSLIDPIKTLEITTALTASTVQALTNWILSYSLSVKGGRFYIGYLTSGLTAKAINRKSGEASVVNNGQHFVFTPIKVTGHNTETMFDINDIDYTGDTYGLNFDISSKFDYTSVLMNNAQTFATAIGYQFAANVLQLISTSTRINETNSSLSELARIELNGNETHKNDFPYSIGLLSKLRQSIKNLNLTIKVPRVAQATVN